MFEAERLGQLILCPFDNPGLKRWYARESNCRYYGAPGQAIHAAIHDTAPVDDRTIERTLADPIPPGRYKVSLRVVGTHWHDQESTVRLTIGDASADFRWERHRKFIWLPLQDIELAKPAQKLALTAVQFGGKGLRILYECQARSIWIDSIYLTSDLTETKGPTLALERCIVLGREPVDDVLSGKTKILDTREIEQYLTPGPKAEPVAQAIEAKSSDGRRNVLPNSSFELGLNDGWAALNLPYKSCYVFSGHDEARENPYHGRYCLRIPAESNAFSRVYAINTGGEMSLSVYARGKEGDKVAVNLISIDEKKRRGKEPLISVPCALGPDWQRFCANGTVPAGFVALQVKNGPEFWLDAVQLEPGEVTDYAPRAEIEGAVSTGGTLGNILYDDEDTRLEIRVHNSGKAARAASLAYRVVDTSERVAIEGATKPVEVPGGRTVISSLDLGLRRRGLFSMTYRVQDRKSLDGELVYAVIPRPHPGDTRHELASNMDCLPAAYELMKRFGFKWQLYCKITGTRPNQVYRTPDKAAFPDAQLELGREFGMKTLPCLWPTQMPKHMVDETRKEGFTKEVTRIAGVRYPKLDLWEQFAAAMAKRYKDTIRQWTIEDETEMYYTARDFAPIVEATARGIHGVDPGLRVTLSCMPDYTEELLTYVDPKHVDGFGASSYGLEHWDSRKIRRLKERYGATWYCIGVGASRQPTMYHSLPGYRPVYWTAAKTARELVYLSIVQDADAIGHYTGRLWNRYGHYNTDFPLVDYDGTPLPHGFSYACVGLLLANAVPLGDVEVGDLGILAYLFKLENRVGAVTWSTAVKKYDQHWKPARKVVPNLRLKGIGRGDVDVLDMYWNARGDARFSGDDVRFDLGEEPTFILSSSLDEARLRGVLQRASADAEPVVARLAFLPAKGGGIDLGVFALNQTTKPLADLRLDARVPYNKTLSKSEWILKEAQGALGTLQPGKRRFGRLPTVLDGRFPVENATFQVSVTEDDGTEHAADDVLWLAYAGRRPAASKVDGSLNEWRRRSASWIYITWSWGRFGRDYCQIHDGGEHVSYCRKIDTQAASWAAYDDGQLYLAFRVDDDQVLFGDERLVIRLDTDLAGDFLTPPNADDYTLTLVPQRDGKLEAKLTQGPTTQSLSQAVLKADPKGYAIELAVPLAAIGSLKPAPGTVIGYDFLVHDADLEESVKATGVVRWAGQCKTMGQLVFVE